MNATVGKKESCFTAKSPKHKCGFKVILADRI